MTILIRKLSLPFQQTAQQLPLRWAVVIPFVAQLTLIVGLTSWLSFQSGEEAVRNLAYQLQAEITKRVIDKLGSYQTIPHQINRLNSKQIDLGVLNLQNLSAWEKYLWQQQQIFPEISIVEIANQEGEQVTSARTANEEILISVAYKNLGSSLITYQTNSLGEKTTIASTTPNYDPRQLPWYQKAVATGKASWSDIYLHFVDRTSQISAALPFYDQEKRLLGVGTTVVRLQVLSDFLATLHLGETGQVLVIEPDGDIVATSTSESLSRQVNNEFKRANITTSTNSITQAVGQHLQKISRESPSVNNSSAGDDGENFQIKPVKNIEVILGDRTYFTEVTQVPDKNGLDWQIIVITSEEEFLEQMITNNQRTLFLSLLALLVSIFIGINISRWIVRPIESLSLATNQVAQGNLDQQVLVKGNRELRTLATNFNQMITELRSSRSHLESYNHQLETTLEELKNTQLQLIQNEKMSSLGQLVAGVAHEINNPVNFIAGNISHAQNYVQDILSALQIYQNYYRDIPEEIATEIERQDIDLEFIQEDILKVLMSMKIGADRIQGIVKSLRNFSRLDESEVKSADIHEGIDSTLLILQGKLQSKNDRPMITVEKHYGNLPSIECYPGQLNQVFMNLLVNAIDALEDKFHKQKVRKNNTGNSPKIIITTEAINQQKIRITIADNANGMPESVKSKIFDPFFTTKEVGKGTGLGLAISYKIITEKHQGNLDCISHVDQGTKFVITLPTNRSQGLALPSTN
ncbi:MAG: HAMP domain-containing protein [Coleofasciculaceae cyanobacterium SM2_1_6]|nr:HAMP domain-containing protein [Coleofasciculaceae cyanobacterium SM2_1_6]